MDEETKRKYREADFLGKTREELVDYILFLEKKNLEVEGLAGNHHV